MKALAHSYVWWPGLDADIVSKVQKCHVCQISRPTPVKAPLHPWEWPTRPWARLHIDHAGPFHDKLYLVLVDAHSKWIDVQIVSSTSAEVTIAKLCNIFATHGLPEQIVSDNDSGFTSAEFKQFILTSPYHPSSNGLAERAVQTFKCSVSKLEGPMESRITKFLFKYRVTPQTTTGQSPAQLLMGRRLRTHLDLLHPDISQKVLEKQQKVMRDKLPRMFQVGDKVFAKNFHGPKWIPGKVIKVTGPLSYQLETDSGLILRRHVDHLRCHYSDEAQRQSEAIDDWIMPEISTGQPPPPEIENHTSDHREPPPESSKETPHTEIRYLRRTRRPIDRYSPSPHT